MSADQLILNVLVGLCAIISFLMSGMEAGVLSLNRLYVRQLQRRGDVSAAALQGFLEKPENFLWTIFVGNTISNFVVMGYVVLWMSDAFLGHPVWRVIAFLAFVLVYYTVCELLPKMLFRLYPNRLCLALVRPFRSIHLVLTPCVWVVARFARSLLSWTGGRRFTGTLFGNRDELRFLLQESAQNFSTEEKAMINRVLDWQSCPLRKITIPLANAVMVNAETPMAEVLKRSRENRHTRFPVWKTEHGHKRIIGIVSLKTLLFSSDLKPERPAGDYVMPALYLPEDLRLEEALRRLQKAGQRLAIVMSRDQREIGIVSVQDILKTIFGEVSL